MRIGQREAHRRVIERRRLPGDGGVALLTGLREASCDVIRIAGSLEILQVTGDTGRGCQVEVVVGMAVLANPRRVGMRIRKREAGA